MRPPRWLLMVLLVLVLPAAAVTSLQEKRRAGRVRSVRARARIGRSRCPTVRTASSTRAGRGDRSAPSTPRRPTASGSRSAANCRCRQAQSRGRRTRCSTRRAETPRAMTTGWARRASRPQKRGWERRYHHVIFVVDRDGKMVAVVAAARQALRDALRARSAQDQDEPVRSREARLGVRRSAARHPQVHLRRQAGDDARHQGPARARRRASSSIGRPTSTGCPTARSSSATATAARASRSSTRTASS